MSAIPELDRLGKIISDSTAELDRLTEASKRATDPISRLMENIKLLSRRLRQLPAAFKLVGSGSKEASEKIDEANEDLKKNVLLIQDLSTRLKKISDKSGITAIAKQAKATGGALLDAGKNVVGWMDALVSASGQDNLINDWDGIKDQFTNVKNNFLGEVFKGGLGDTLGQVFSQLLGRLKALSSSGAIKELAKSIGDILGGAIKFVSKLINYLLDAVEWSVNTFGSSKPVVIAVAAVLSGPLLASLYSATSAIVGLGVAFLTTPIGQFLALVGLIGAAAAMIFTDWNPIAEYFPELWSKIVDTVGPVVAFLVDLFEPITRVVRKQFARLAELFNWLGEHWDGIVNIIMQGVKLLFLPWRLMFQVARWVVGKVAGFVESLGIPWGKVFAVIVDVFKRLLKTWVWLMSLFISPFDAIGDALDFLSQKWNEFFGWVAPGIELVKNLLLGLGESFTSGVMEGANQLSDLFKGLPDAIDGAFEKAKEFFELITNPSKLVEGVTQKITNLFSFGKDEEKKKSESSGLGPSAPTLAPGGFFGQFNGEILVRLLQDGMLRVEQQSASRNLTLRTETGAALMAG